MGSCSAPKDRPQPRGDETIMLIVSGSYNSPFPGKSQTIKVEDSPTKQPKSVVQIFKQKFRNNYVHEIQSKKESNTLLGKKNITTWLAKHFRIGRQGGVFLFYVGHGHINGDWAIQTLENPDGDRLSLQELTEIWVNNRISKKTQLNLFMDSCYSGFWPTKISTQGADTSMNVFASCSKDQKGKETISDCGLFYQCILSTDFKLLQRNIKLLMEHQSPTYFVSGMNQAKKMQPSHLILLQQSIKNARKLNEFSKTHKQQKFKQNKRNQGPDQNLIKILQAAKVSSWSELQKQNIVDLSNKGLTHLPQQFMNLTQLTKLSLLRNDIRELPQSFANLVNLNLLEIGFNKLTQVPSCIFKLKKLFLLGLGNNQISVLPLALFDLPLRVLGIQSNKITQIPQQIEKLAQLQKLSLCKNQIKQIPQQIGNLSNLTLLAVNGNRLQKLPGSICKLVKIQRLLIHDNSLSQLPQNIGNLQNLQKFHIHNNPLKILPQSFAHLKQLRNLSLTIVPQSKIVLSTLPVVELASLKQLSLQYHRPRVQMEVTSFEHFCGQRGILLKWSSE